MLMPPQEKKTKKIVLTPPSPPLLPFFSIFFRALSYRPFQGGKNTRRVPRGVLYNFHTMKSEYEYNQNNGVAEAKILLGKST